MFMSGGSSFAWCLTRSTKSDVESAPPEPTMAAVLPLIANGTSIPSTARPSARR